MSTDQVMRPARRFAATALVTVVSAAGTSAAAPSPSTAAGSSAVAMAPRPASPALSDTVYERRVQDWVNVSRRRHGLRALRFAACTDAAAERWSSHLAARNAFYHQAIGRLLERCNASYAGETLGRGTITPRRLVSMWMHSPPHRHVLLSKSPRRIGIGAVPTATGEWVVAAELMRF